MLGIGVTDIISIIFMAGGIFFMVTGQWDYYDSRIFIPGCTQPGNAIRLVKSS